MSEAATEQELFGDLPPQQDCRSQATDWVRLLDSSSVQRVEVRQLPREHSSGKRHPNRSFGTST